LATAKYDSTGIITSASATWLEAFHQLSLILEKQKKAKKIAFLDELPWLDTARSGGISGIPSAASSWTGASEQSGAQIDLVLDRSDRIINLFEMKFSVDTFTLDKKYADELRKKITVFREQTRTRKAIFLTMITTFGLNRNTYAISMVQNELTMDV